MLMTLLLLLLHPCCSLCMNVQGVFSSWNCFSQKTTQWHHPRWGSST